MSDRPYPGESLEAFRSRRKAELSGGPAPESGFEAKKSEVAAQHGKWGQESGNGKRAVNIDNATDQADALERHNNVRRGGVQALDMAAIKAADKDKSWAKKSPDEQVAVARKSKDTSAPTAHTTETPGSSHQTSMGAALSKAGVQGSSPAAKPEKKAPAAAPSREVSERNNMGTPRGRLDTGIVTGREVSDSGEASRARAASEKGTRKNGGQREAVPASPKAAAPKAAPASPQRPQVPGGRFVNNRTAAFSASMGVSGDSSPVSGKPAANPAPQAPSESAPNTGFASLAGPSAQSRAPMTRESVGLGKPKMGTDITYGVANPKAPAAKVRGRYNAHIADGGTTESYWTARDANKAAKSTPRAAKAPKEAVAEQPSIASPPSAAPKPGTKSSAGDPGAAQKPAAQPAPSPAPSRAPVAQKTPLSSQMTVSPAADPSPNWHAGSPMSPQTPLPRSSPAPSAPANPSPEAVAAPKATGRARSTGRVGTISETVVQPASAPRAGTAGAARAGGVSGGEHSINIGGDNHGSVTTNHNTYNLNYGHVGGSIGNVDHGYAPRGGSSGGGRGPGGGGAHGGHDVKGDAWVRTASGTHSVQGAIHTLSGQPHGHQNLHQTTAAPKTGGGQHNRLEGSPRSAGGSAPAQAANPSGTGSTNNWQGPQAGVNHPASGIGTAQHGQNP